MSYPPDEMFYGFEACGLAVRGRIEGWSGALVKQADLTSISYKIFDLDNFNEITGSGALVVADVIFDEEQESAAWPYADGYNFLTVLPATCFPVGGHLYRSEFIFTPAAGEPYAVPVMIHARDLLTY